MTKPERVKLSKLLTTLMAEMGATPDTGYHVPRWTLPTDFGCPLVVTAIDIYPGEYLDLATSPWVACCFSRPAGQGYADIREALGEVNQYSGKHNCHLFDVTTADDAIAEIEHHLRNATGIIPSR